MATAIYEYKMDKQTWLSMGSRLIYHFTRHTSLAIEVGYDQVKPENEPTRKLAKLTVAPQLPADRGFFSRPVLRAFVTYAKWNGAAQIAGFAGGTGGVFGGSSQGASYGFQVEAWR